jgi:protein-S-isoprenylcysteine O-methyltransferase Ste14
MPLDPYHLVRIAWETLGILWLVGMAFTKPAIRKQPLGWRLVHVGLGILGFALIAGLWFQSERMQERFVPGTPPGMQTAGLALTLAGCLFAAWARLVLGRNWSGRATVKAGHELITRGPYALARHPIYTGLLTALAGTVMVVGTWPAVAGLFVIALAFVIKMRQEEKIMMETFPETYPIYRQRVKALIPGVL